MKYKVGDRVRIKVLSDYNIIVEKILKKTSYILVISEVRVGYYYMEEAGGFTRWTDNEIECLASPKIVSLFPTNKRFELMDIE